MELQSHQPPVPVYIPVQKKSSGFGTIVVAMLTGAFIATSFLYMWGADVSEHQKAAGATPESSAR